MAAYRTVVVGTDGSSTSFAAVDRAAAAGAREVRTLAADNVGLNSLSGRIVGSVPLDVARRAGIDVLIVHTI